MAKIRNGFVSNSSSSSFIIDNSYNERDVSTVENEIKELLGFYNNWINKDSEDKLYEEVFDVFHKEDEIIIDSVYGNSIPHVLWEFIEEKYGAYRRYDG